MIIAKKPKANDFLVGRAETRSKPLLYSAVREVLCWTIGKKGTYYSSPRKSDLIYVYHSEKVRPKFKQMVVGKGRSKKKVSEKVRDGVWKLRVFAFPADRVESVKQYARNFKIVLK
jgi:hypothetical protein